MDIKGEGVQGPLWSAGGGWVDIKGEGVQGPLWSAGGGWVDIKGEGLAEDEEEGPRERPEYRASAVLES